jgi:FkbM family methyltransferase
MIVFFLKRLVFLARIFKFLVPTAIRMSKEYLEVQYREALALDEGSPRRAFEINRLASLRQKINPPAGKFLVDIHVEGLPMRANLCQQYCGDIYYGLGFEHSELSLVKQFVQKDDTFFDVGANIGVYTLLASQLTGEGGHVHSFEPLSDANELLRSNVRLNQCGNVTINPVAIGEENGEVPIYINAQNALSSLGDTNRGKIVKSQTVRILTLDTYAESAGISKIDFLKIDVEGFEGHVLRGAEKLIETSPNLVVMSELAKKNFAPLGFSLKDVLDWMRKHGFDIWMIGNQTLKLYPVPEEMMDHPFQNFLFVRPENPKIHLVKEYSAVLQ